MMQESQFDDHQVMNKVSQGKVEMLAILFERHHKKLFNFLLRLSGEKSTSEDLVQDVFFRMLKYRHTYKGKHSFITWMYQIARNVHYDYLRKYHREKPTDTFDQEVDPKPLPSDNLAQEQEFSLLNQALSNLPPKKREILVLSRFHHLKYKEIAVILNCSIQAIKVEVHRALKDLKKNYIHLKGGIT